MLNRRFFQASLLLALWGCNRHPVAQTTPPIDDSRRDGLQVITEVYAAALGSGPTLVVAQGELLRVRCVAQEDGALVDPLPMQVRVTPPVPVLQTTSVETVLTTPVSGPLRIQCIAATRPVPTLDPLGVMVEVRAVAEPEGVRPPPKPQRGQGAVPVLVRMPEDGNTRPAEAAAPPSEPPLGLPYTWNAHWPEAPQGRCYWQNRRQLLLQRRPLDRLGRPVEAPVRIHSDPPAVVDETHGSILFPEAGVYRVTAELAGPIEPDAALTPLVQTFYVDSTPPRIEITSPKRAAMLQSGTFDPSPVRIEGFIEDSSGLVAASVNGETIALEPGQKRVAFASVMQAPWGMSTLSVAAQDMCDMQATHEQSFLRSPTFADSEESPAPAVRARLAQAIMDDGERGQLANVASVIEQFLTSENLAQLLPVHLSASPDNDLRGKLDEVEHRCLTGTVTHKRTGHEVLRTGDFTFKQAKVDSLVANEGHWDVRVTLTDLRLPVKINAFIDMWCMGQTNPFWLDTRILADKLELVFQVDVSDEEPRLSVHRDAIRAHFSPGDPRIDTAARKEVFLHGPSLLVRQIQNGVFRRYYAHLFASKLQDRLRTELVTGLQYFLNSIQLDSSVSVSPSWQEPLRFRTSIDRLHVGGTAPGGFSEIGLAAQLTSQAKGPMGWGVVTEPKLGPIRSSPAEMSLALAEGETIAMALHDDFINQGLYALWTQNAFTVEDLSATMRTYSPLLPEGMELYLFSSLPPVLMPGGVDNEVKLGWGDIFVDAKFDIPAITEGVHTGDEPLHATLYISALLTAKLEFDADTQQLVWRQTCAPELKIQALDLGDPGHQAIASAQLGIWVQYGLPRLEALLWQAMPHLTQTALDRLPPPAFKFVGTSGEASGAWQLANPVLTRPAHQSHSIVRGRLTRIVGGAANQ